MTYQSQVLSLSPLLYLPLTETAGVPGPGVFADASGHGHVGSLDHHTTPGGADSFLTGEKAAILQTNAIINFAAGSGFAVFSGFTVEFWLQVPGSDNWNQDWLTLHLDDWPSSHTINLELDQRTGSNILTTIDNSYGVSDSNLFPFTHVNCWHHYAVVYDSTSGQVRRYLDGVLMSRRTVAANPAFSTTEGYITAFNGPFNLAQLALYGTALTGVQIAANYAAATPRQDAACFVDWVRLAHVSGQGYWQSTGDVVEEWAGGVKRLALPFGQMSPPAEFVLGKDPTTGLPLWVDPPSAGSSVPVSPVTVPSPTPPVVPPAAGDACIQTRCGAAVALQTKLVRDYDQWRQWINAAISFAVGGLIASVLAEIATLLAVAEVAAWVLQVFKLVSPIIRTATVLSLPSLIPNLTGPQVDALLHAFFCQVQCASGVVAFGVADQQAVSAALLADTSTYPSDLMRTLLGEIVYHDPIQDWQAAMSNAPVSDLCDGMTCP